MRKSAALFPIALAAIILAPEASAREEGPFEIEKCQTISQPGSYKLANNLATASFGDCLVTTGPAATAPPRHHTMTRLPAPKSVQMKSVSLTARAENHASAAARLCCRRATRRRRLASTSRGDAATKTASQPLASLDDDLP